MEQAETPVVETANKYELMAIFLPDLGEEAIKKELSEIKKLLSGDGGEIYHEDIWGLKDLAYRIRKQDEGYYAVLNFSLPGNKVAELEHLLNIRQTVLRYLVTKTPFDYKITTLKDYEAESEKLDKEEQKVKDEAAARKGRKRPAEPQRAEPQRAKRAEAPKQDKSKAKTEEAASASRAAARTPKADERRLHSEKEGEAKIEETATASRAAAEQSDSASEATEPQRAKRAEAPSEEEAKPKIEETAPAPNDSETEPSTAESTPKKAVKKAEKADLDDFDKRLKSIIDDPDISL